MCPLLCVCLDKYNVSGFLLAAAHVALVEYFVKTVEWSMNVRTEVEVSAMEGLITSSMCLVSA